MKPDRKPLIHPQGLDIPHDITRSAQRAISWIRKYIYAYQQCYRCLLSKKNKEFENIVNNNVCLCSSFDKPYGKWHYTSKIVPYSTNGYPEPVTVSYKNTPPKGYAYQTHCTVGVSTFLYYRLGYDDYKNRLDYSGKLYKKHPISILCQFNANAVIQKIEDGSFFQYMPEYCFQESTLFGAVQNAESGGLSIAVYTSAKEAGHLTTIIGDKQFLIGQPAEDPIYNSYIYKTMVYNVGATCGYMPIEEAFGEKRMPDVRYYILMTR